MIDDKTLKQADFVSLDSSRPPEMWAWSGEPGDPSSTPIAHMTLTLTDMLLRDWKRLLKENEELKNRLRACAVASTCGTWR